MQGVPKHSRLRHTARCGYCDLPRTKAKVRDSAVSNSQPGAAFTCELQRCNSWEEFKHQSGSCREDWSMLRVALYLGGVSAAVAAWVVFGTQNRAGRIPVKKAAAMLQEAWADHHTIA